jgi:outer membrane protein OmpA-like peptidoglycan-associated protein
MFKLRINGHTDNVGKEPANVKLSQGRADAIKNYLVKKGINKNRINSKGFGSKKPIATNTTDAGRQQNRRVEFQVIK